jgi:hypothetical protein
MFYAVTAGTDAAAWFGPVPYQPAASSEAAGKPDDKGPGNTVSKNQLWAQRKRALRCLEGPFDSGAPASATNQTDFDLSACSNIHHPLWHPINEELVPFIVARMEKKVALNMHFSAEYQHRPGGGGNCFGMSAVWRGVHQMWPDGAPAMRMQLLMSRSGTTHAVNIHTRYKTGWNARRQLVSRGIVSSQDFEQEVIKAAAPIHATIISADTFRTSDDYQRLGRLLCMAPGYYELRVEFATQGNVQAAAHALDVFWRAGHSNFAVCDTNVGEGKVGMAPGELPRFMAALSGFYWVNHRMQIAGVTTVQKMEFTLPISETLLANLAQQLFK